jgi:UDPglucose--hexose-1-phosphate uridylyltransferase
MSLFGEGLFASENGSQKNSCIAFLVCYNKILENKPMPELRKDPIIGRWVIVAKERSRRPDQFVTQTQEGPTEKECPFCEGQEFHTPPEIYALRPRTTSANTPGWEVRIVPSIAPFLKVEGELDRRGKGLYDLMSGIGAHEIVIETNKHIGNMAELPPEQIAKVISCYIDRINDLSRDIRFKSVLIFKNYGWVSGAGRIKHSRSQIIATPVVPKRLKEELAGAKQYYDYHERCVFCDLIRQELVTKERLILETTHFVAVTPFAARFPFEVWILPKHHACDFPSLDMPGRSDLALIMNQILSKLFRGLNDPPYNYIIHTAPFRRSGKGGYWKSIDHDFHWHLEIIPRLTRVAGFEWGTGFYICPLPPEDAAHYLRDVQII